MGRALLVIETEFDRRRAVDWIGKAPVGTRVEFKASKRSLPQNDMLWALLTEFSQQFTHDSKKYDPTQWKAIFLHAFGREISFLPSLDGKTFLPIENSSSDLSKEEMTDFIEFILKEGAERGVVFKKPIDHESGLPLPDAEEDSSPSSTAEPDVSPASGSPSSPDWLPTVARMLVAATNTTGDVEANLELLNTQRLACGTIDGNPSQAEKNKAGSIYRVCKQLAMSEISAVDAKKAISVYAGIPVQSMEIK